MRTESLVSMQSGRSIDSDAWYKQALNDLFRQRLYGTRNNITPTSFYIDSGNGTQTGNGTHRDCYTMYPHGDLGKVQIWLSEPLVLVPAPVTVPSWCSTKGSA